MAARQPGVQFRRSLPPLRNQGISADLSDGHDTMEDRPVVVELVGTPRAGCGVSLRAEDCTLGAGPTVRLSLLPLTLGNVERELALELGPLPPPPCCGASGRQHRGPPPP